MYVCIIIIVVVVVMNIIIVVLMNIIIVVHINIIIVVAVDAIVVLIVIYCHLPTCKHYFHCVASMKILFYLRSLRKGSFATSRTKRQNGNK